MDTDEVTLDWGAHDDEEGVQAHSQTPSGKVRQEKLVPKDEATMSGAESLLALASGGVDAQDDKDSDVVSLGGGEDDMEELYAYQSRTHLGGGVASGDNPNEEVVRQSKPTEAVNPENGKSTIAPAASSTSPSSVAKNNTNSLASNDPISDSSKSQSKPNNIQPQPRSKVIAPDSARSPSTTRLAPPTGPLGLPPKPVAVPPTPYIRPSHPSIMSASSMAAPARDRDRDMQRDHHDGLKGKLGPHRHISPENESLQLAPGWETRRSRDGTQDMYYYNTKTQQSTWSRSIATGMSSAKPEGSASPGYARSRGREQFKPSSQDPPASRDVTRLGSHDAGSQPRSRSTRFDMISTEPSALSIDGPGLSFEERHYRPDDSRPTERTPPYGNGDLRGQPQARGPSGPHLMHRDNSPVHLPTHPPLRHGSDRVTDFHTVNRVHSRDRDEREMAPFGDRAAPRRNGERRVERSRSRSPGRQRSRNMWPNELVSNPWVRDDDAVSPSNEQRRLPAAVPEGPRPSYGGSTPPLLYRGASQIARSSSLGREDRSSRYAPPPNHDQSSSRDRHRSPPPERPRKRPRSKSPDFNKVNPRQAFKPPPQSQPSPHTSHWNEFDPNQSRQQDQTTHFDSQSRDRHPLHFQEHPTPLTSASMTDRVLSGDNERDRPGGGDFDREDAKRRKVIDNTDFVESRRPHLDSHGDRDTRFEDAPRRKRQPLPPQSERFKEVAAGPPATIGHISSSRPPLATPSGPRRLLTREANYPDALQQPGRGRPPIQRIDFEDTRDQMSNNSQARHFEMNDNFVEGKPYEGRMKPRQWDRDREKTFPAELPTGPRAMDHDAEPPRFSRRDRSPPRQHSERSPPPHFITNGPHNSDRRDHLGSVGFGHSFGGTDRSYREPDRQSGSRAGDSQEFGQPRFSGPDAVPSHTQRHHYQQQQHNKPMLNSKGSGANNVPVVTTRKFGAGQATHEEVPRSSHANFVKRPESGRPLVDAERWEPRATQSSASISQDPTTSGNFEEQHRASYSRASSSMRFENPSAPASLPPSDETSLPGNPRHQPSRVKSSYNSTPQPPVNRQLLPENDVPAVWDRRGSISHHPTETREGTSERPKSEHPAETLQPEAISALHPRDNHGNRENQLRHPPRPAEISMDPNRGDSKQEGSLMTRRDNIAQHSKTKGDTEAQPGGPAGGPTEVDPQRSRPASYHRPLSPPPGARSFRIRRPSRLPEPTLSNEHRDPAGSGQSQASRPTPRQGSLLDRISNPSSSTPGLTPPLRDRVSSSGDNWKRGVAVPQTGPGTSLRDRLENVGDARHPMNVEWEQSYEDAGNGSNRRDRQNRRDRSRRGGRGQ